MKAWAGDEPAEIGKTSSSSGSTIESASRPETSSGGAEAVGGEEYDEEAARGNLSRVWAHWSRRMQAFS